MSSSTSSPDSPSVAQANIQKFYQGILDRAPDAAGLGAWTAAYENGILSYSQIEAALAASPEAQSNVVPIIELYQAAFNRVPDQTGLAGWVQAYDNGTPLSEIAQDFVNSAEFQKVHGASASDINGSADAKLAFVASLYQNILGRQGSTSEISTWANSGLTVDQILLGIANSQEAGQKNAEAITQFLTAAGNGTESYTGTLGQQVPPTPNPGPTPSGQTYTLNSGPETIVGTAGNDTFNASFQTNGLGNAVSTLNPFDSIDGNGGSDTLNITDSTATGALSNGLPQNVTLRNIANVNVASTGAVGSSGSPLDLTQISGLENANVVSTGGDTVSASNAANVAVSNTGAGAVNVTGGLADTVNTQGGSVDVSKATGAVQVNVTKTVPTNSGVTVTGGTTVSVDELATPLSSTTGLPTGSNNSPITIGANPNPNPAISGPSPSGYPQVIRNLSSEPTGNVTVNAATPYTDAAGLSDVAFGTGLVNIFTNGATSVSATGTGSTNIEDVQTTPLKASSTATAAPGTSTLATVNLDGLSGGASHTSYVTSDALANLSVLDSSGGQTVDVVNNTPSALNLTVGNDGSAGSALTVRDDKATTVNVDTQASAYQAVNGSAINPGSASVLTLQTPSATVLNVKNGQALNLAESGSGFVSNVASVTASGSGALTLDTSDTTTTWSALKSIDAGASSGAVTATIDDTKTGFLGGSGNNTLIINNGAPVRSLNGGSGGNNTLVLNAASTFFPTAIGANTSKVSNFQTLGLGSATASGTYDGGGFSQFSLYETGSPATQSSATITDIGTSNATLSDLLPASASDPTAFAGGLTLDFNQGRDSLTLNLGQDSATSPVVDTSLSLITSVRGTDGGVTNMTINSMGAGATGGNAVALTDPALTSLSITGDEGVTVTAGTLPTPTPTTITSIDASGNSATATTSVGSASGHVDVTSLAGQLSAGGVTIKGGSALLLASSSDAPDTVTSGSGGLDLNITAANTGEHVNLAASAGVADTINVADGSGSGTTISPATVISGFQNYAGANGVASDSLTFLTSPTILASGATTPQTGSFSGQGITYSAQNGFVTFGGNSLSTAQLSTLVQDLEGVLDQVSGGGGTAAFQYGSDTYVVHSAATTSGGTTSGGSLTADRVIDLQGVTGITSLTNSAPTSATALWVHSGAAFT